MKTTRTIIAVGALAATALLSACGDDDDAAGTITSPEVSLREAATDTDPERDEDTAVDTDDEEDVDIDAETDDVDTRTEDLDGDERGSGDSGALASKEFDITNASDETLTVRVDVVSLERASGDVVRMDLRVTNLDDSVEWSPYSTFSARTAGDFTTSGISLIDLANDLRYLVLTDSDDRCLCTTLGGTTISAGESISVQASFPAPPADVAEVDVQLGQLGVMGPVPVSDR